MKKHDLSNENWSSCRRGLDDEVGGGKTVFAVVVFLMADWDGFQ